MIGFRKNKSVIEVQFFEEESDTPFAVSHVPIEQLPDTFEIDTIMHLGDDDWRVVGADPARKGKFGRRGKLRLHLAKHEIHQVSPNEILYSLPTINNEIAGVEKAESLADVTVLHEDDWRQFEFIDKRNQSLIDEEFSDIEDIYENHKEGMGFNNMHLRQKIAAPLENIALTRRSLRKSFDIVKQFEGVAFNNAAATVVNGFALETKSGWLLWGQVNESGNFTALNVSQTKDSNIMGIASQIDAFTEEYGLYLIDWPRLFWCGAGKSSFSVYTS